MRWSAKGAQQNSLKMSGRGIFCRIPFPSGFFAYQRHFFPVFGQICRSSSSPPHLFSIIGKRKSGAFYTKLPPSSTRERPAHQKSLTAGMAPQADRCRSAPCRQGVQRGLLLDVEEAMQEKRKVLIYSQFTSMLALIGQELCWPFLYLDGSVATFERTERVRGFQEDPRIPLFLLSLKAGGG
jgi:hypothetical protein